MRGLFTPANQIRRQVFTEVAKMAYENRPIAEMIEATYSIIKGEVPQYRESVFLERAVVGERLRLAIGLPLRKMDENQPLTIGAGVADITERFYSPPLINVIKFACNKCEQKAYKVSDACQGCLAHPCVSICPVGAVSMVNGKSYINKEKCIKCGRCREACPYNAIILQERPCAAACGVGAIETDELGRATINQEKCVSCGMCLVSCPFAAIADKSQIYQLIKSMQAGDEVIAAVAPAFVGQFGSSITPQNFKYIMKQLGFADVVEVAVGADIGTIHEAHHFLDKVPGEQAFLATSCCPSWSVMAKRDFPTIAHCVSDSLTPMVATARMIKAEKPNAKVVFIGPCAAKKLEAARRTVQSQVDFVITFEELMGMMVAKEIDFASAESEEIEDASKTGRGYAIAGGVADGICDCIKSIDPDRVVPIDRAEGLANCKKMLQLARAGKRNGYILEGMACPGGCVGGAGTILPPQKAADQVKKFAVQAKTELEIPKD